MARQIKFTVGNATSGYKTVEIGFRGGKVSYKILRNGLLNVDKKNSPAAEISEERLAELDALDIFAWEKNYSSETRGGVQWSLTFTDGKKNYCGRGYNAYPENWTRFLDWLDVLIPELEFVNRRRLERVIFDCADERLTLDRNEKTMTLDKKNSSHVYEFGANTEKFFDACQKIFDDIEIADVDSDSCSRVKISVTRHDKSAETFETFYTENFLPGLTDFIGAVHELADDLTAKIFSPATDDVAPNQSKLILCKVRFKESYKHYTYRTDDETLAVGDVVDVPVGRYNDVNQARIVEIGYFEEYEAPFPVDKIKKIIGKHTAADWENL